MSTVYRVKRKGRLPIYVDSIDVELCEDLYGLARFPGSEGFYDCCSGVDGHLKRHNRRFDIGDDDYLKTITAKITGRGDNGSVDGNPLALGHIKAVFVKENMARHREESHKGAESLDKRKDEHSESLRMLNKTIKEEKVDDTLLGFGDGWGDILLIEDVHLQPPYRGYGISLLAVDRLMIQVAGSSVRGWNKEGIIVIDASGLGTLGDNLGSGHSQNELQEKLMRHWPLLGLRPLVPERSMKEGKRCKFVGQWRKVWCPQLDIATVVPHLFGRSTPRETAAVPPTTLKRERSPEGLVGLVDPPANKRKRKCKRKRSKKVTPDQPGDVNQQYLWDLLLTV